MRRTNRIGRVLGFARCSALETGDWMGKGPPLAASSVRLRLGVFLWFEMGSAAADARFEIVFGVPVPRSPRFCGVGARSSNCLKQGR